MRRGRGPRSAAPPSSGRPSSRARRHALRLLAVLPASALATRARSAEAAVIAAAADLQFALPEIARRYEARTGRTVRLVFGSSGNFRRQIAAGAPFELFLSADEALVLALAREGHVLDEGEVYAIGRIALLAANGSPVRPDEGLEDLAAAIDDGRLKRFAIANPEHAPYGRAAQEALARLGLWERVRPRLALGENVAQAAQFVSSGNAQAGIVALSLALAPELARTTRHALLPESLHSPLRQRMALTRRAGPAARAFYDELRSAQARETLARYGFAPPATR